MKKTKTSNARAFIERITGPLTFGSALRSIRLGEEVSLEKFAAQLSVSRGYLCDVELGRRRVSASKAAEWGRKLGYGEAQFVRLVLQDELDTANIDLRVSVSAA